MNTFNRSGPWLSVRLFDATTGGIVHWRVMLYPQKLEANAAASEPHRTPRPRGVRPRRSRTRRSKSSSDDPDPSADPPEPSGAASGGAQAGVEAESDFTDSPEALADAFAVLIADLVIAQRLGLMSDGSDTLCLHGDEPKEAVRQTDYGPEAAQGHPAPREVGPSCTSQAGREPRSNDLGRAALVAPRFTEVEDE
jgi:hypothetical protein